MITARKSAWFERVFAVYNRNLLARRFEGLRVAGLRNLSERGRGMPLVLYANHSSWWDGLVAFEIGRACALDQYVMMEERQLARLRLFRRLGAFSVRREHAREARRSVEYAGDLLRETGRALWLFPQGTTLPNDVRPLKFYAGAAHIIRRAGGAYVAPVAMRYEFLEEFRPEAFARVGSLERVAADESFDAKALTQHLSDELTRTLDRLRADVLEAKFDEYQEIAATRRRRRRAEKRAAETVGGEES
jgi:1-acyl-sn-glycerol-3-phosphate acyltransferase